MKEDKNISQTQLDCRPCPLSRQEFRAAHSKDNIVLHIPCLSLFFVSFKNL